MNIYQVPVDWRIVVYPNLKNNNAKRLAGKYRNRIPEYLKNIDYAQARDVAFSMAMKDKYDLTG